MRMFMAYYIGALFVAVPVFALGYWYGYWVCARQAKKVQPELVDIFDLLDDDLQKRIEAL